jgi:hypothetical protein
MSNETDVIPGLEELATAARERSPIPAPSSAHAKRRKVPNLRILRAGGIVLRGLGVLIVIAGFWPVWWALIEAHLLFGGAIKSEYHFIANDERFAFQLRGWFAIIPLLIVACLVWCIAIVAFAMGHALYVIRDLAKSMDNPRPPAG